MVHRLLMKKPVNNNGDTLNAMLMTLIFYQLVFLTISRQYSPIFKRGQVKTTRRHSVKSVRIRSYSGLHFHAFGLNTERYRVSLRIQSECGKMPTRIIPNTDTFYSGRISL